MALKKDVNDKQEQIKNAFSALKNRKSKKDDISHESSIPIKKERKKRVTKDENVSEEKEIVVKNKAITSVVKDEKISTLANGMEKELRTLNPVDQVFPEGCSFNKKPTVQGLVWLEKCLKCSASCKIEALPKSVMVKCPDFKA